jgi:hypothetical protein
MEFRLIYSGELFATTQGNRRVDHKHSIRKLLHPQLKQLWAIAPRLDRDYAEDMVFETGIPAGVSHTVESLAKRFSRLGYSFVPLVTRELGVYCELDILFLRPDPPGGVVESGDIDNRMKTLFDAISMPREAVHLGRYVAPAVDEVPFFCLVEDDSVITKLTVETDRLLSPMSGKNDVHLVITVRLRPISITMANMAFA